VLRGYNLGVDSLLTVLIAQGVNSVNCRVYRVCQLGVNSVNCTGCHRV